MCSSDLGDSFRCPDGCGHLLKTPFSLFILLFQYRFAQSPQCLSLIHISPCIRTSCATSLLPNSSRLRDGRTPVRYALHALYSPVSYTHLNVSAKLYLTYVINNEGAIKVTQKMTADKNAKVSPMFRFGMQMQMPKCLDVYKRQVRHRFTHYGSRTCYLAEQTL